MRLYPLYLRHLAAARRQDAADTVNPHLRSSGGLLALNLTGFRDASIAKAVDDFEDFAPSRKLPTAHSFVVVHGFHEIDFIARVVAFARRGIDLPTPFHFVSAFSTTAFFARMRCGVRVSASIDALTSVVVAPIDG
jgi:hypothetical protein